MPFLTIAYIIVLILLEIAMLFAALAMLSFSLTLFVGAPYVKTDRRVARRMFELGEIGEGQKVLDIGSGAADLLIIAAKEHGAKGIGIEINPLLVYYSRLRVKLLGLGDKIEIRGGNFFHQELPECDLVSIYLWPKTNEKLVDKLSRELVPGTPVISHGFTFKGWEPEAAVKEGRATIYRYRI